MLVRLGVGRFELFGDNFEAYQVREDNYCEEPGHLSRAGLMEGAAGDFERCEGVCSHCCDVDRVFEDLSLEEGLRVDRKHFDASIRRGRRWATM